MLTIIIKLTRKTVVLMIRINDLIQMDKEKGTTTTNYIKNVKALWFYSKGFNVPCLLCVHVCMWCAYKVYECVLLVRLQPVRMAGSTQTKHHVNHRRWLPFDGLLFYTVLHTSTLCKFVCFSSYLHTLIGEIREI